MFCIEVGGTLAQVPNGFWVTKRGREITTKV